MQYIFRLNNENNIFNKKKHKINKSINKNIIKPKFSKKKKKPQISKFPKKQQNSNKTPHKNKKAKK